MAVHSYAGTVRAPDFPDGLDWLNVFRPLHIKDPRLDPERRAVVGWLGSGVAGKADGPAPTTESSWRTGRPGGFGP